MVTAEQGITDLLVLEDTAAPAGQQWWHVFGHWSSDFDAPAITTLGPGKDPALITDEEKAAGLNGSPYLTSVDHDPSDEEMEAWFAEITAAHDTTPVGHIPERESNT